MPTDESKPKGAQPPIIQTDKGARWDVPKMSNFPGLELFHYSYANSYPSKASVASGYKLRQSLPREFALAADVDPGSPKLMEVGFNGPHRPDEYNSPNHFGHGQNVLFADGHVEFWSNPFAGFEKDNIYTFGQTTEKPAAKESKARPHTRWIRCCFRYGENPNPPLDQVPVPHQGHSAADSKTPPSPSVGRAVARQGPPGARAATTAAGSSTVIAV